MPFVKIHTNLAKSRLPPTFMSALSSKLATILNKDLDKMNVILETDKSMLKGSRSPKDPFMMVEVEALQVFDSKEDCHKFMPQIFGAVVNESGLGESDIVLKLVKLEGYRIGKNGKPME